MRNPHDRVGFRGAIFLVINALAGGGAEKQAVLVATGLRRQGFECHLFWLDGRRNSDRLRSLVLEAEQAGVAFYRPPVGWFSSVRQFGRLWSCLARTDLAVLWTWGYRSECLGLLLRLANKKVRQIGSMRSANSRRIYKVRWLWRLLGRTHSAFVSNSFLNLQQVSVVAPRVLSKSAVIYNAIEPALFAEAVALPEAPPPCLKIVMLGNRHVFTKGYDIAVELAEKIARKGLPIEILIGGGPAEDPTLPNLIEARGVAHIAQLVGEIAAPAAFLRRGHLFLMLSRYEGTPNALLEAMAVGLPVICTRVGDVESFLTDRQHGRLINANSDEAMEAVCEAWSNWPQSRAMAAAGRALSRERFSHESMVEATASVMDEVIATGAYAAHKAR